MESSYEWGHLEIALSPFGYLSYAKDFVATVFCGGKFAYRHISGSKYAYTVDLCLAH